MHPVEEVFEIDTDASFLRILHGLMKFDIPDGDNIYKISAINRTITTSWITATLGHDKFHRAWPKPALETLQKAGFEKKKRRWGSKAPVSGWVHSSYIQNNTYKGLSFFNATQVNPSLCLNNM